MTIRTIHGVETLLCDRLHDDPAPFIKSASVCIHSSLTQAYRYVYPTHYVQECLNHFMEDCIQNIILHQTNHTFVYTGEKLDSTVRGILSVSEKGHILLCHVDGSYLRKGIGTAMWRTYLKACDPMNACVDAPLCALNWFLRKGFLCNTPIHKENAFLSTLPLSWKKTE